MVIQKVSFNFANKSGLLSSATQVQLSDMAVRNGLQMNYYEFSGQGVSNDENGDPDVVPTIGSILVIDPAIDLSIDTNMSGGQYNIQVDLTLFNQSKEEITPTLYLVCVNSSIFITEDGTCNISTGMLTKEMTLETKVKDAVMDKSTYEQQIVGGSIENLSSVHKHMKLNFHKASEKEHQLDKEVGETAPRIGSGMSASGVMPKRRIHKFTA